MKTKEKLVAKYSKDRRFGIIPWDQIILKLHQVELIILTFIEGKTESFIKKSAICHK